jgi:hypothetical protein
VEVEEMQNKREHRTMFVWKHFTRLNSLDVLQRTRDAREIKIAKTIERAGSSAQNAAQENVQQKHPDDARDDDERDQRATHSVNAAADRSAAPEHRAWSPKTAWSKHCHSSA